MNFKSYQKKTADLVRFRSAEQLSSHETKRHDTLIQSPVFRHYNLMLHMSSVSQSLIPTWLTYTGAYTELLTPKNKLFQKLTKVTNQLNIQLYNQ